MIAVNKPNAYFLRGALPSVEQSRSEYAATVYGGCRSRIRGKHQGCRRNRRAKGAVPGTCNGTGKARLRRNNGD